MVNDSLGPNKKLQVLTYERIREIYEAIDIELPKDQSLLATEPAKSNVHKQLIDIVLSIITTGHKLEDVLTFNRDMPLGESLGTAKQVIETEISKGVLPFATVIDKAIGLPESLYPERDLVIVDEAQDLSDKQWQFVDALKSNGSQLILAGDDRQGIHEWAGANVERYLSAEKYYNAKRIVLEKSNRVPQNVHAVCQYLTKALSNKYDKRWLPKDERGSVLRAPNMDSLSRVPFDKKEVMLLGRTSYRVQQYRPYMLEHGIRFTQNGKVSTHPYRHIISYQRLLAGEIYNRGLNLIVYGLI